MSGRRSRDKGAVFERRLATTFRAIWPDARRGIGQTRFAGEVPDVEGTPYWVEAKRQKRPNINAAVAQARKATDGRPILVVTKRDREPTLVTMDLCTFLRLSAPDLHHELEGVEVGVDVVGAEEDADGVCALKPDSAPGEVL